MVINFHDKNSVVTYLQIYLQEHSGLVVNKVVPRRKSEKPYYEITGRYPLEVTGIYDTKTYSALALFMFYNYPNEGYPLTWKETADGIWISEDSQFDENTTEDQVLKIISDNIENSSVSKKTLLVPERVLSYIFEEVVGPSSSYEEVERVKKMVYSNPPKVPLHYDDHLMERVKEIQRQFIEKYVKDISKGIVYLDEFVSIQFKDFKVTGYVDPWTELVLKGRLL